MYRTLFSLSARAILPCILAGCTGGSTHPDLIPVTGSVTYNGAPVAGAEVSFFAVGAPRAASDVTDAEGNFSLSTFDPGDGTMAGENIITVVKIEGGQVAAKAATEVSTVPDPLKLAQQSQEKSSGAETTGTKYLTPEKYALQTTTPLKEVISATNNKIPIKLVD